MGTAWLGAWFVNHATSRDSCVVHATEHGVYFEPCHPLFSFKLTFDFFKNRPISQNCLLPVTWQVTFKITKKAIVLVNESEICSCFSIIFVFFQRLSSGCSSYKILENAPGINPSKQNGSKSPTWNWTWLSGEIYLANCCNSKGKTPIELKKCFHFEYV